MTKKILLQLYERLKREEINVEILSSLKYYKDEEIDMILNNKYINVINLLLNNDFKTLDYNIKKRIIEIINKAKNQTIATSIISVVEDENVLLSGLVLELIQIISETRGNYQAQNAAKVSKNRNVLQSGLAVTLTELVAKIGKKYQSESASLVATDREILLSGQAVEITELISKTNTQNKTDLAVYLAINKTLLKANKSLYYIRKTIEAKSDEEVNQIFKEARQEINNIKRKQSEEQDYPNLFWNIFNNNPEEAILLLSRNISSDEEITPLTKVRKLGRNK